MNARHLSLLFLALVWVVFASGCADAVNVDACAPAEPRGFVFGLIHGFIAPFAFIVSLFDSDVAMYAVNNNGGWYDFGFVLGSGILFGGSGRAGKRR